MNRQVPDRRGDGATATSSTAALRSRGSQDAAPATAAEAEHMAQATALLEQFKAKNKNQSFGLAVRVLENKKTQVYIFGFCSCLDDSVYSCVLSKCKPSILLTLLCRQGGLHLQLERLVAQWAGL